MKLFSEAFVNAFPSRSPGIVEPDFGTRRVSRPMRTSVG
jgi:hypothetical protein